MGDPSVIADAKRYRETVREHTALRKLEAASRDYFKIIEDIEGNETLLGDPDFAAEAGVRDDFAEEIRRQLAA